MLGRRIFAKKGRGHSQGLTQGSELPQTERKKRNRLSEPWSDYKAFEGYTWVP